MLFDILPHLDGDRPAQVDLHRIGQSQRIADDIGQFIFHITALSRLPGKLFGLFERQPLEVFHQLGRFDGKGHAEILRHVKLVPPAFGHERLDQRLQFRHRGAVIAWGDERLQGVAPAGASSSTFTLVEKK